MLETRRTEAHSVHVSKVFVNIKASRREAPEVIYCKKGFDVVGRNSSLGLSLLVRLHVTVEGFFTLYFVHTHFFSRKVSFLPRRASKSHPKSVVHVLADSSGSSRVPGEQRWSCLAPQHILCVVS